MTAAGGVWGQEWGGKGSRRWRRRRQGAQERKQPGIKGENKGLRGLERKAAGLEPNSGECALG